MSKNSDPCVPQSMAWRSFMEAVGPALVLMLLTLMAGVMLDHAGAGKIVYPASPGSFADMHSNALQAAIVSDDVPAVRRLLAGRRGDINSIDRAGSTLIHYAVHARRESAAEMLDLLIDAGADVNGIGGKTTPVLLNAATLRRPELVERLLRAGADPDRGSGTWTALHYAAMCDDPETAALLLASGADPRVTDDEGHTPLDIALTYGSSMAASLLTASCHRDPAQTDHRRDCLICPASGTTPTDG